MSAILLCPFAEQEKCGRQAFRADCRFCPALRNKVINHGLEEMNNTVKEGLRNVRLSRGSENEESISLLDWLKENVKPPALRR